MSTRLFYPIFYTTLLIAFSSCNDVNFSKDFEFDLTIDVNSDSTALEERYLLDATEYVSSFEEKFENIETVEVQSATCFLVSLSGIGDQILTNGLLTASNENGSETQTMIVIPTVALENLLIVEQPVNVEEAGITFLEDLIMNDPHTCLGKFTGNINSSPAKFTINFHFVTTVTGNMLSDL